MTACLLEELCAPEVADDKLPIEVAGILLKDSPPPRAIENLTKLQKLGILNGDTLMSLIAQAPIDPINLAGTLMQLIPGGWVFSAVDFSMMRVLSKQGKTVFAAMHVDLMGNNVIKYLAVNRAGKLVTYKDYTVTPSDKTTDEVLALVHETVAAAKREMPA